MDKPLPEFDKPPVVEVAFSVQFDPLEGLHTPYLGLLWEKHFRERFPEVEEHAPLDPMMERFGVRHASVPGIRLEMLGKPPTPRCWFLNEEGTELVQVQRDRFARNWRMVAEGEPYPRYEKLRDRFLEDLAAFLSFAVADKRIAQVKFNQCELTYVNHITAGSGWDRHGQLAEVLAPCVSAFTEEFLPEPEELRMRGSFVIPAPGGEPLGRLRFSVEPGYRRKDDQPIFVFNLVARGRPDGTAIEGVKQFLDTGHVWIVRGFAALTTPSMHKVWRRTR